MGEGTLILVFWAAWCVLLFDVAVRWQRSHLRQAWPAVAVLLVHALLAVAFFDFTPMHDHASFVSRAECAAFDGCLLEGPWAREAGVILGWIFLQLPGPSTWQMSIGVLWAFGFLAMGCMYSLVQAVVAPAESAGSAPDEERRSAVVSPALWALALVALNPLAIRLLTAGTFWPYTAALLFGGLLAAERGYRLRAWWLWPVAGALWAFATLSNYAVAQWGLLPFVAMLCAFARGGLRKDVVLGCSLMLLVFGIVGFPGLHDIWTAVSSHGPGRDPVEGWRNQFIRHPTHFPWFQSVAAVLGVLLALHDWRKFGVLLAAYFTSEWILAAQVGLEDGYPTRYIHGVLSFFFLAIWAALGVAWLVKRAPPRLRGAPAHAIAAVAIVLSGLVSHELWRAAFVPIGVSQEYAFLRQAIPALPRHDRLVLLHTEPVDDRELWSDWVWVEFPELTYVQTRLDDSVHEPLRLTRRDAAQRLSELRCDDDALVYVGTALRSYLDPEFDSDPFRADPTSRPLLQLVASLRTLTPALVTEISTAQPAYFAPRLAGDTLESVEIGFYYLTCPIDSESHLP